MDDIDLTLDVAISELAEQARIYGKRAGSPEDRLIWAQAEVAVANLAKTVRTNAQDGQESTKAA